MDESDRTKRVCCPECGSYAVYRYGRSHNTDKQRYICLLCERQFIPGFERVYPNPRPVCPTCGRPMYLYKKIRERTMFRCSDYPNCRTYLAVREEQATESRKKG